MLPNAGVDSGIGYSGRGAPEILDYDLDVELPIIITPLNSRVKNAHLDVGTFSQDHRRSVGVGRVSRSGCLLNAGSSKPDGAKKPEDANGREGYCPASENYLFFGGISGPYLGLQVFLLTLGNTALAGFGILGLYFALDNPNVKWRLLGGTLAIFGLAGCVTFNNWTGLVHPLRFWWGGYY